MSLVVEVITIGGYLPGFLGVDSMEQVFLKKILITQLVNKSPPFMEPKDSLPCSKEPTSELSLEQINVYVSLFKYLGDCTLICEICIALLFTSTFCVDCNLCFAGCIS
jgi:hypothetical protein